MPSKPRFTGLAGAMLAGMLLAIPSLHAEQVPNGYRSAEFGMSSEEVKAKLEEDRVVETSVEKSPDGDLIIDGHLADPGEEETGVRYVFPAGSDRLALVVEFHPDADAVGRVQDALEQRFGEPWTEDLAGWWFEQLKDDMPAEARLLVVWGGGADSRNRFVRLWVFEDYLSVEYLDTALLSGRQ